MHFQFPHLPTKLFNEWIGSSEWESQLIIADDTAPLLAIDFSADVPKRDAVVTAFKVCIVLPTTPIGNYLLPTLPS